MLMEAMRGKLAATSQVRRPEEGGAVEA